MSPTTSMGVERISAKAAAHDLSQLGTGGAGASDAGARDLRGRDAGGGAGLAHGLLQRLAGLHFTDANNVAGAGGRGGQELRFVADHAGGFGAAAVDAEIVGHGLFLTQGSWLSCRFGARVVLGPRALTSRRGVYRVSLALNRMPPNWAPAQSFADRE